MLSVVGSSGFLSLHAVKQNKTEAIVSNAFYHQNERIITYTEIDEHKVKNV